MNIKYIFLVYSLLSYTIYCQEDDLNTGTDNNEPQLHGAFGAVTIDGKIWNQLALRPVLPFGELAIAFDMVLYIDQDGNIHDDEWDFSDGEKIKNTLIDKIYYIRYGNRWGDKYFKIGALDNVTMGYGILLNNYSNTLLYPQVRKVGMEFSLNVLGGNLYGFTNDFKENLGLAGVRFAAPIPYGLRLGVSWVGDRNQYLGLRDSDGDGRPDIVDDFPDDKEWYVDTDGDGLDDRFPLEWDIDGDGITDTLNSDIPGWNLDTMIVLDTSIMRKPEPLNVNTESETFNSFAFDIGIPILNEGQLSIDLYAQFAALIGKTEHPIEEKKENAGYGIIPLGLSARFGPATLNFEFRRMPIGRFEFGYFDRSYEVERAIFQGTGDNQGRIVTKSNTLGKYREQSGFYSSLNLDLGSFFDARMAFQNLNGNQYDTELNEIVNASNQSFTAILKLKKTISKIESANWFYQQRNVPNPFDFEYSESTILGYNIGLRLGNGMVLTYVFRRTFQDMNGDGDVNDFGEMNNMTRVETSFSF